MEKYSGKGGGYCNGRLLLCSCPIRPGLSKHPSSSELAEDETHLSSSAPRVPCLLSLERAALPSSGGAQWRHRPCNSWSSLRKQRCYMQHSGCTCLSLYKLLLFFVIQVRLNIEQNKRRIYTETEVVELQEAKELCGLIHLVAEK